MIRLFRLLFWAAAIVAVTMALWPLATPVPTGQLSDKWQHMIAFFTLTVLAVLAYPGQGRRSIAVAMMLLGLGIELAQWGLPMLKRQGSGLDLLADCAATLAGLLAVAFIRPAFHIRLAERSRR